MLHINHSNNMKSTLLGQPVNQWKRSLFIQIVTTWMLGLTYNFVSVYCPHEEIGNNGKTIYI